MSSALLFAAIVVLWAGVLVPLWLRRDAAREDHPGARSPSSQPETPAAGETIAETEEHEPLADGYGAPTVPLPALPRAAGPAAGGFPAAGAPRVSVPGDSAPRESAGSEYGGLDHVGTQPRRDSAHGGHDRQERHARIMAARRRMLMMLVALTGLAVAFGAFRIASWWVVAAPALLLAGYLMLLREAAHMDAELRKRRMLAHAAAPARTSHTGAAAPARGASAPGPALATAPGPAATVPGGAGGAPGAAARGHLPAVGHEAAADTDAVAIPAPDGELYDQYADARLRAIGD